MLFNSYEFIFLYLPIVLLLFFWLARFGHAYAAGFLALASLFFYGYWQIEFLALLMASIVGNYFFGLAISRAELRPGLGGRKSWLVAALGINLLLLGYFKYCNFFIDSANSLVDAGWSLQEIVLPMGISFFTFTQIAFLVDCYQGKVQERNFIHYTLFVTYFPHLIAGPVLHHAQMMPQFALRETYRVNWDHVACGILLFVVGLFKKVFCADSLAPYADAVFDGAEAAVVSGNLLTAYEAWAGALAYTLQIYFDFSGYTDMALGIALMFNVRLPINFNSPYQATSMIEFWRRWHISLSTFLRDYLYIPLGGNRKGKLRRYSNLLTTMLLGGLWHGAGWTFVIWGGLHGLYLTLNHLWRDVCPAGLAGFLPRWLAGFMGGLLTFLAVVVAWVFFRAETVPQAMVMLNAMFAIEARPITFAEVIDGNLLLVTDMSGRDLMRLLVPGLLWVWLLPNSNQLRFVAGSPLKLFGQMAFVVVLFTLAIDQFGRYSPFLYFQF